MRKIFFLVSFFIYACSTPVPDDGYILCTSCPHWAFSKFVVSSKAQMRRIQSERAGRLKDGPDEYPTQPMFITGPQEMTYFRLNTSETEFCVFERPARKYDCTRNSSIPGIVNCVFKGNVTATHCMFTGRYYELRDN